ncbi:hypothetical protein ND486_20300 [Pseudonocardia sp. DR1-2]|uniref:hypothetical protein n=1 Tax=Pseudonocardia sp. DR1-2 TaxID=2951168 RepID=UPI0020431F2B|nr:hypothetical protein [Pseudonocardia sp. DR1-2]MCM3848534.1 hypothetical protein [Pseudonocardia sp. DR1-2]
MFVPGSGSVVVVAVALLVVVAALVSPAGRRAAVAALGSVGRWPALIRAEMRGDAPLSDGRADTADTADDRRFDTTPEMPAVRAEPLPPTSTFPQVRHPGR